MTDAAKKLLEEVRALPAEDRRWLREQLDETARDEALRELVLQRAGEIERGEVVPGDAMDVYHRLVAKRRD